MTTTVETTETNESNTETVEIKPLTKTKILFTLKHEATQGEENFDNLKDLVLEREMIGKGRPSLKDGRWRLSDGNWARRKNANFTKIDGEWKEVIEATN